MEQTRVFDLSVLDIRLPQVGEVIEKYRQKYTTDGAAGMPPHVTLLYPFLRMQEYTPHMQMLLAEVITTFRSFSLHLGGLQRFPGVLYLDVNPREPIRHMIQRLVYEFPDFPPYGGNIPVNELIPHVTLAVDSSEETLDMIAQEFTRETAHVRFEHIWVDTLSFSVRMSGQWNHLSSFQLGKQ